MKEEVVARLKAEQRLKEAEVSLARLEKAVSEHVYETARKSAAAAATAAPAATPSKAAQTAATSSKEDAPSSTSGAQVEESEEEKASARNREMMSDVKTLKSEHTFEHDDVMLQLV